MAGYRDLSIDATMVSMLQFLLSVALVGSMPHTQQNGGSVANEKPAPRPPAIAAPGEVDTLDHIVAALYSVISGPAGEQRNWDRMRSLFIPNAVMGAMVETRSGAPLEIDFTVDRYIKTNAPYMEKSGFYENEIGRRTEEFGHIAQIFSTYESRYHPKDKPFERGINSLQLFNDGTRWWVRTILWEGESAKLKLPSKYVRHG